MTSEKPNTAGSRGAVAAALFADLERSNVSYCVVGVTEGLPHSVPSDLDIVVASGREQGFATRLNRFCLNHGVHFVQALQHEQTATYYALGWRDEKGELRFLHPDVCSDYLRYGRRFLTAGEILSGRRLARDEAGNSLGFHVPAPASEFIYYLLKRVDKRSIGPREGNHLNAEWQRDPEGAARQVWRFWRGRVAQAIVDAAKRNDWSTVRAELPQLQKKLCRRIPRQLGDLGPMLTRICRRVLNPTGFWVAFLGPDGAGKTSVQRRVSEDLAPAFRRVAYFHLRPRFGQQVLPTAAPVTEPHGQGSRSALLSTAKVFYFLFDYLAGYAFRIRPALVRSTFVLFDRYFHDLLVDPRRYRYGGATWLVRLAARLVPKPDLWVLLDATPEVVVARKGEVTLEEAARQRDAYRAIVEKLKNVLIVDATRPLEDVVCEVEDAILDRLQNQTRRHLGL
ncbi:MAG: thymidylate kinase-like protein [Alphaproteobacteria bacterium]|nr:thymidylate kinase-like protein [Alphaproteobacteria bacterium]